MSYHAITCPEIVVVDCSKVETITLSHSLAYITNNSSSEDSNETEEQISKDSNSNINSDITSTFIIGTISFGQSQIINNKNHNNVITYLQNFHNIRALVLIFNSDTPSMNEHEDLFKVISQIYHNVPWYQHLAICWINSSKGSSKLVKTKRTSLSNSF